MRQERLSPCQLGGKKSVPRQGRIWVSVFSQKMILASASCGPASRTSDIQQGLRINSMKHGNKRAVTRNRNPVRLEQKNPRLKTRRFNECHGWLTFLPSPRDPACAPRCSFSVVLVGADGPTVAVPAPDRLLMPVPASRLRSGLTNLPESGAEKSLRTASVHINLSRVRSDMVVRGRSVWFRSHLNFFG